MIVLTMLLVFTTGHAFYPNSNAASSTGNAPSTYTLSWMGYDWDGAGEETLMLNGHFRASLPTLDSPQNSNVYTSFSLDISSLVVSGSNTLTLTHANWDCGTADNVKSLEIDSQTGMVFKSSTVDPLSCTQSLTYNFNVATSGSGGGSSSHYTMQWMGYDWDGTREETISLNGHFLASLPSAASPQNSGVYSSFSLDISSQVVQGSNALTFTHANWDCAVSDNVKGLQISNQTAIIFRSSTVDTLSCTQSLTYHFDTASSGSSGGGGGGGGGSGSGSVPILIGWGGVRLDEAVVGGGIHQPSSPTPSAVFAGESATNMELLLSKLKPLGYDIVKVSFDPSCTGSQFMSAYSATNLQRAIQIAQHFDFWIVVDYHGFTEPFTPATSSCWLNFWSGVVGQFKSSYSKIIWEPEDEPKYGFSGSACSGASACVSYLSNEYQQWINQARSLGDTHWIVVENICSFGCGLCPGGDGACSAAASGFPMVTDPLGTLSQGGRIFISLHTYMDYGSYSGSWNSATAESVAQQYYQAMLAGVSRTGWPVLDTESGASPLCGSCAPDRVLTGNAGYTVVTFHFLQTLTSLLDGNTPQRINWINWPAGSWTDTPNAGIYGAMQCNSSPEGWGCSLQFKST